MLTSKLLATLLLATVLLILGAHAQIQVPPTNLTTGFVRFPNGTSQVTWFYTPTGLVAYDGDAIFGTVAEFNEALVNITYTSGGTDNSTNSTIIYRRSYPPAVKRVTKRSDSRWPGSANLWPGGKVYYRYWDDNTESQLSQYIDGAIASWANAVPCISFVKLPNDNDPAGSNGIVTVVAHNPNVGYCLASQIGYGLNSLWMSLDTGGGCGVPEVTHEWGHLLGLIHEQKRPDSYINDPFICSNLIDYPFGAPTTAYADANYCGAPPSYGCAGWACQFTVSFGDYNSADPVLADGGAFDLNSIMLYRNDAFALPGTFTLTGGPNAHNNPQQLSPEDILRVRELYGCLPPPPAQCPAGCNPNPGANMCSWPTAQDCIYPSLSVPNPRAACACRAGYKATDAGLGIADGDTTKQWRLPADEGNFRVWVAEGVACDTLCDVWYGSAPCQEVGLLGAECLHT